MIATEDLHWADPSTLELTQLLVEQGAPARLLLLYTARPEFHAPWPMRAHHTQINLNRLTARDVRTMVAQVAARIALSDETVATVVERTGGVPLFVEELTRAVLESGDAKLSGHEIPATLHDSLMARLDRLGPAKEVIQVGAVIGSEFSYELLQAVHPISEAELQAALRSLADAELLYVRGIAPDATYQFKHALIRDAAYEALLKSRRKDLHLIVARTIDEKFPALKEAHPELLARHWTEAGETEPAISAWQKAGERAVEHRAYHEAERYYREAIVQLNTMSESPERDSRESALQLTLGNVTTATHGFSAPATVQAYSRARLLAERVGGAGSRQLFNAINGVRGESITRGELQTALALADQLLEIARDIDKPRALTMAHFALGNSHYYLGNLLEARRHLLRTMELYREEDFARIRAIALDPGVSAHVWSSLNEWVLGYPDQALRYTVDAFSLAHRLNKPVDLANAGSIASHIYCHRGDFQRAVQVAKETVRISIASGFRLWKALGEIRGAWASAHLGEAVDSVARIRAGLAELDAVNFYLGRPLYECLLGEVQALAGATDDALATVERALQVYPDEVLYRPYALWVRGELRLKINSTNMADLAEADFREAITSAQSMSAKSWELRATTSLARLLTSQGRRDEARAMLAAIYNWFTEGFDTADLIDAKTLLDELSA